MLNKDMKIDKSVPIPLYFQLKSLILEEIQAGNYKTDDSIPTEKEISKMFDLSRTTVRQAIMELVQEGWLYRIKSKGTFVSHPKIQQDFIKKVESFNDQIIRSGMTPSTKVLVQKVIKVSPDVAQHLNLNENDKVIFLKRKRLADGNPIVVIDTYLPYKTCSFVMDEENLEKKSLYSILKKYAETTVYKVDRVIEAIAANEEDARYLNYSVGKPIQYFSSVGYTIQGTPVEYSLARYRGDRSSFEITVSNENK